MSHTTPPNGATHSSQPNVVYVEAPKKSRKGLKIGCLVVGLILLGLLVGCMAMMKGAGDAVSNSIATQSAAASEKKNDTMKVEGTSTGAASAQYGPATTANTAKFTGTFSKEDKRGDSYYSITVQDESGDTNAKVTCKIFAKGKLVEEKSATGAYSIASCQDNGF